MFQFLYFCCQGKEKEQPHTILLEDNINQNSKNMDNINNITQANNYQNNMEDTSNNNNKNTEFYPNDIILNNKGILMKENNLYNNTNPNPQILTINNINNININLQRNSFSKEPTKLLEKKDSKEEYTPKNDLNEIKEIIKQQTIISGENSKEILQNKSFISFSNLTIKYVNNNAQGSSINFSDTEIVSLCELTLSGDLFFNKEIKIDRSGIKNINLTNTNRIQKNKNRKICELKFGVLSNDKKHSLTSLIKNNEDNNNNQNINNKNSNQNLNNFSNKNKFTSIKSNQKKKIQSISSISSLNNNSIINKNYIDVILNLPYSKIIKKLNENVTPSNNVNNNENIILFILKYDTSLDMFKLSSTQEFIPIELLLNYNYPLRFQQTYNILIGGIKINLKVIKNDKNESMLDIIILNNEENNKNKNGGEKKNDVNYKFNPFIDKMPITIGRINCDININNIAVSKLHAQIDYIYDYDEFFITDCKSTNGTYLLLKNPLNSIYIKRELHLKLFESKFKIQYVSFDN